VAQRAAFAVNGYGPKSAVSGGLLGLDSQVTWRWHGQDAAPLAGMVCWPCRGRRGARSCCGRGCHGPATDPLTRQLALSALTTEQLNLQTARMGTIAEANGRSTLYLGTLSSAVIALAFVGQLGDTFYLFALTLLPPCSCSGYSAIYGWSRPRSRTW
jgi:hypothetical protein